MDIYKKRSYLNMLMALFGLLILIVTLIYSNFLAQALKQREEQNAKIFVQALQETILNSNELGDSAELNKELGIYDLIVYNNKLRVILEDETGYLTGNNWGEHRDTSIAFLASKKKKFIASGKQAIEGVGYAKKVYYFNSRLVDYINYYPYIQILLVGSFVLLGFFLLTTSRKAQQNRVWAGMAKETAHQLGTPISAIMAWIEHLRLTTADTEQTQIIDELESDVNRLELIADRFSKIGSDPILKPVNIYHKLEEVKEYMEKRASKKIIFDFPETHSSPLFVGINEHLFDWVVENLIRNALDAMDGTGKITVQVTGNSQQVYIDVSDTGKGIHSSNFSTVFQPGFTTKQRGWGLGLSLAKRIIENYHKGKIYVKSSKLGEGTTFTIKLPVS